MQVVVGRVLAVVGPVLLREQGASIVVSDLSKLLEDQ